MILDAVKKYGAYVVAAVFAFLYFTAKPACPECPKVLAQNNTVTKWKLVYPKPVEGIEFKPLPCPEITYEDTHWQSVAVQEKEAVKVPVATNNVLYVGAGYLVAPYGRVGYGYGPWRVEGALGVGVYGGGVSLDVVRW